MFIQVFRFYHPSSGLVSNAAVVHVDRNVFRSDFLCAQRDGKAFGQLPLCLGGIVDIVGPEIFLVGQARTVEHSRLQGEGQRTSYLVAQRGSHVAHVAHLLGYE